MRYLLHRNQRGELTARQKYLYGVFKMYFLPDNPEGSYIPLIPLGESDPNLLFITGHTPQIENHLKEYLDFIPEDNIIITSCFGEIFKKFTGQKNIYIPKFAPNFCFIRNGKEYGFDFKISDVELDFYNVRGNTWDRIHQVYQML